jgi:hypothetical protein
MESVVMEMVYPGCTVSWTWAPGRAAEEWMRRFPLEPLVRLRRGPDLEGVSSHRPSRLCPPPLSAEWLTLWMLWITIQCVGMVDHPSNNSTSYPSFTSSTIIYSKSRFSSTIPSSNWEW